MGNLEVDSGQKNLAIDILKDDQISKCPRFEFSKISLRNNLFPCLMKAQYLKARLFIFDHHVMFENSSQIS